MIDASQRHCIFPRLLTRVRDGLKCRSLLCRAAQYRQLDQSTFTFKRNSLIQRLVNVASRQMDPQIRGLLSDNDLPDAGRRNRNNSTRFWVSEVTAVTPPIPDPHATSTSVPEDVTADVRCFSPWTQLSRSLQPDIAFTVLGLLAQQVVVLALRAHVWEALWLLADSATVPPLGWGNVASSTG